MAQTSNTFNMPLFQCTYSILYYIYYSLSNVIILRAEKVRHVHGNIREQHEQSMFVEHKIRTFYSVKNGLPLSLSHNDKIYF